MRRIGIALGVIVVVLGALWGALAVMFPPETLRAMVQKQLAGSLAREVRFEGVSMGIFPPVRLTVQKPALAEPGGFARGALFRARAVNLDLDVVALLGHRVVVKRLVIEGPEVHVLTRADGTTNLDGVGKPPSAQPPPSQRPMDLSVREFTIRDGRVLMDDLKAGRRTAFAVATTIALDLRGGSRFDTHGTTHLTELAFGPLAATRLADLDQSLAKLDWTLEHDGAFDAATKRLALKSLALSFGRTKLGLSGVVQDPGLHSVVDLRAQGAGLDLGEILGFVGKADARVVKGIHGGGALDFDLGVRGALGAAKLPDVTGTLRVARGWFQYAGAPAKVEDLAFAARFAPDSLGIPALTARVANQPLRARLAVRHFADPWVAFALQGDLDLAAVAPFVTPKDSRLSGHAVVDLSGAGRAKDPTAMAIDGRARLSNVSVQTPSLPKPMTNLRGDLAFSQTKASVTGLAANAGSSSFALDAKIDRPLALMPDPKKPKPAPAGIAFDFRSPALDLADVMPQGGGGIVLPNASGGGRVNIARLRNQKLDMQNLVADVRLAPEAVDLHTFNANVYGGFIGGAMKLDMADTTRPLVIVKAKLDSARVEKLIAAWLPRGDWLDGALGTTLDLAVDLKNPRRSLSVASLAALTQGALSHAPVLDRIAEFAHVPAFRTVHFRDLTSSVHITQGRVFTGPATLHGPEGDWLVTGSAGLDGSLDYGVSVTVPPALVQQLGARAAVAAGALADPQGRVLLDFHVTGTAGAPKVAWDPSAMRARLEGKASELIAEQKAKYEQMLRDSVAAHTKVAQDSARAVAAHYKQVVADSLRRLSQHALEGFFGPKAGAKTDTTKK